MQLKHLTVTALLALASWCVPAWAQDGPPQLKAAIERNTQGKVKVDTVTKTPVPGIYEVSSAGDVFYVDETGRYGFVDGRMMDLLEQKDLTAAKLDKINAIDFNALPLKYAIKEVRGNGQRKLAVFEDPNCPICRVFHKFVAQLDDVTIYKFMFPVWTCPVSTDSLEILDL